MLTYKFINDIGETRQLQIKLLSNDFVKSWKQYLIEISPSTSDLRWNFRLGECLVSLGLDELYIKSILKNFIKSFTWFSDHLGIDYQHELQILNWFLDFPEGIKQSHLNHFHRIFTTLTEKYTEYNTPIPDNIDELEFLEHLHLINQSSHDLEPLTYPHLKAANFIRNKLINSIRCSDSHSTQDVRNLLWSNIHQINTTFDPLTEDHQYTVWLADDIRGKDMIKAWVEEDDLTADDCTGNTMMTPNILLDPNNVISSVINHPDWRAQYVKSGKMLNRFPIGNILYLETVNWSELSKFKIQDIELDGKSLWKNTTE